MVHGDFYINYILVSPKRPLLKETSDGSEILIKTQFIHSK